MDKLFGFLGDFHDVHKGAADTFCDRLSSTTTVFILGCFTLLINTRNYLGEPIACWCPSHFAKDHVDFANKVTSKLLNGKLLVVCKPTLRNPQAMVCQLYHLIQLTAHCL